MKHVHTRGFARVSCAWLWLTCSHWPSPCRADDATSDPRAQAIALGKNAIELYQDKHFHLAADRFRSAERIRHSPVFVLYLARCSKNLGQLLDAKLYYQRAAVEVVDDLAPAAWRAARDDARLELAELELRIPSIQVRTPVAFAVELRLDGRVVDLVEARNELFLDPGRHELVATNAAGQKSRVEFSVPESERLQPLEVRFTEPARPRPTPQPKRRAEPVRAASAPSPVSDALGVTLLAVGAVGVGVGTVTGVMSIQRTRAIEANCDGVHCLKTDADEGRVAARLATASDIGFALGGVALAAWGVRIWLSVPLREPKTASAERAAVWLSGEF